MSETSTITSVAGAGGDDGALARGARPQLVMLATAEEPHAPSARHLLDAIDEVRFGRGERSVRRIADRGLAVLELRLPDRRMSRTNGRLVRRIGGWHFIDPESKNAVVIDGIKTRDAAVHDGTVIELGHTFFLFRHARVEAGAADDVDDAALTGPPALRTFDGELAERFALVARVAPTEVSVLLQGETGTGKELVARALHAASGRRGELVPVNCGALPQQLIEAELFGYRRGAFTGAIGERVGLVRSADHGTLFLDEVGELPAASQAAFLRVLQEREVVPLGFDHPVKVDVRLCSATLRNLDALVEAGQFRRDLFARLFGLTIELPPLRARRADLGLLIRTLLAGIPGGARIQLAPSALVAMIRYHWPFNIREREKVLATAVALAPDGVIELAHLPEALRAPGGRGAADRDAPVDPDPSAGPAEPDAMRERGASSAAAAPAGSDPPAAGDLPGDTASLPPSLLRATREVLRARLIEQLTVHQGNVVAVARVMKVRRTQVYRWLARLAIDPAVYRRRDPES